MPAQTTIHITPQMSFEHFYRSRLLFLGHTKGMVTTRYILGAVVAGILAWNAFYKGVDILTVIGLIGVTFITAGRNLVIYFESRRLWQTFVELGITNSYALDDKGLRVRRSDSEEEAVFYWEDLAGWKMNDEYIIIAPDPAFFVSVETASLAPEVRTQLMTLLTEKLGPAEGGRLH